MPLDRSIFKKYYIKTLVILIAGVSIFILSKNVKISYAWSDPYLNLVVTQSILDHGTLYIDSYEPVVGYMKTRKWNQMMEVKKSLHIKSAYIDSSSADSHYYNYFPPGPSLLSVPFVWIGNLTGSHVVKNQKNIFLQKVISGVLLALVFITLIFLLNGRIPFYWAILFSFLFTLGSSFFSTMANSIWSLNYSILLNLLALIFLLKIPVKKLNVFHMILLGVILFFNLITRPTAAFLVLMIGFYLLIRNYRALIPLVLTMVFLLMAFSIFSLAEFGTYLPPYFINRIAPTDIDIMKRLYGILLSPSRGVFIFNPLLVIAFVVPFLYKELRQNLLIWLFFGWFIMHLVTLVNFDPWWGGWSYGPRLFADGMISLLGIIILAMPYIWANRTGTGERILMGFMGLFLALGLWINVLQGPYNNWSEEYNRVAGEKVILNWRYPQFLADEEMIRELEENR